MEGEGWREKDGGRKMEGEGWREKDGGERGGVCVGSAGEREREWERGAEVEYM